MCVVARASTCAFPCAMPCSMHCAIGVCMRQSSSVSYGGFMKHVSKLFLFSTSRTGLRRSYNFIYHFNNRFSKFFSNRFSNQSLQQACHWRCKNKKKASCLLLFKRRMTHIKAARLVRRHQWHKQWHQQSHLKQQKTTRAYRSSTTLRNRGQRNDRFRWRA